MKVGRASSVVVGPVMAFCLGLGAPVFAQAQSAQAASDCTDTSASACLLSIKVGGGRFRALVSNRPPGGSPADAAPVAAIVGIHGHPRDVEQTFDAVQAAVTAGHAQASTLIVAPVFQVAAREAAKCKGSGAPPAEPGDLTWTCESWIEGAPSRLNRDGIDGPGATAFAAMDALLGELATRWPSLRTITIAGFSAGAQLLQHGIGLAAPEGLGHIKLRYVVASPGTWLYFDARRPRDDASLPQRCPGFDDWKYGLQALPAWLDPNRVAIAKARYGAADVHYLVGERDSGPGPGTAFKIMDKSCAAEAQGSTRLERALAYAAYDRADLAPSMPRFVGVVPGCAHDVACVFPSREGISALLGP